MAVVKAYEQNDVNLIGAQNLRKHGDLSGHELELAEAKGDLDLDATQAGNITTVAEPGSGTANALLVRQRSKLERDVLLPGGGQAEPKKRTASLQSIFDR